MEIDGLAAVVTGGASGLGAATARALSDAGAKVAVLDRDEDAARAVADDIQGLAVGCDVSDADSMTAAMAVASAAHGPARIAVACAGIAPAARLIGRGGAEPADVFDKVIAVNLTGTFHLLRLAAAEMAFAPVLNDDGERGVIVTTASIAAYEGQMGQIAYAASKGGIASITLPAARELARFGVRVASIAPGLMATPMLLGMPDAVQESLKATTVFPRRLGKPTEYAWMVLQIVENPLINGEVIRLDGALRMAPK